ncbi:AAA family ATPase [Caldicellulosiruptor bescii]|uniref:AAA family ATPase n=1 Tax=Caldicellulosiruptor bescii TaxID=31899 RepID=UPI000B49AD49|nr:AAA family ATPase [Caldicellulosiruptor bescii]SMR98657.1 AAA domain-containing protein [Caldicellulosiruptor bescii]
MAQLIGNEVVAKVIEWLGIKQTKAELLSMAELLSLELPPVEFLLEGLLPNEGLTILAGREKIGKSWLCLELALSLAAGTGFLGRQTKRPYKVLYLALEDSKRRLQQRIKQLGTGISQNCFVLFNIESLQELEKIIIDHNFEVVIVDTMQAFKRAVKLFTNTKLNTYEQDYNISLMLNDIAKGLIAPL